jgi:hypothetical protein
MSTEDANYFYYACRYENFGCKSRLSINKTTGDFQTTCDHDEFCYKNHFDKQKRSSCGFGASEDKISNINIYVSAKENNIEDSFAVNSSSIEENYSDFVDDKSLCIYDSNKSSFSSTIQNTAEISILNTEKNTLIGAKRKERIGLKYKMFSLSDKEKFILMANKKSIQFVSKKIGVQTKTLKRWIMNGPFRKKGNF